MIVEASVRVRVWCEASGEASVATGSHIAAAVVDGVSVLVDNPDDRCMAAYFVGGEAKANRAVAALWQKFQDGAEEDFASPKQAMKAFVRFLMQTGGEG